MPPIQQIHMLGPLQLVCAGRSVSLKYNKARALLAYLARQSGFHTRAALADLLWPGDSAQAGRDKLKRMLFYVREALGSDAIEANRQVVRLLRGDTLWLDTEVFATLVEQGRQALFKAADTPDGDAAHFESLTQALSLYRGPFMQGLSLDDAPDFEHWLAQQREDDERRLTYALRLLIDGYRQRGELAAALPHARRLAALQPLDEGAARTLIELLSQQGPHGHAEAEAERTRLRTTLQRELGLPPEALARVLHAPPASVPRPPASPAPPSIAVEERRQITVVACDLTARGSGDPDDTWITALRMPMAACQRLLRESAGYTVRSPAGILLAYFGYPLAIEGAARRAVETALACSRLGNETVRVGVGVHTGVVVSSASTGMPDSGGRVSRFATRLSETAPAGEVLLSADTARLIGARLSAEPRGTLREHHGGQDIAVYVARQPPAGMRGARTKPLAGRASELAWLNAALGRAGAPQGQRPGPVCLLLGDAGIGKTHLLQHFRATCGAASISLQCRPEAAGTPFHPFADWLRHQMTTGDARHRDDAQALYRLLHGEADADAPLGWKDAMIARLLALLDACVPPGGVIACDDAHWADPSTHDVLASLAERSLPGRLLVVAARTPFHPTWQTLPHVQSLTIAPLTADATAMLVDTLAGGTLPSSVVRRIAALADGVPLFAGELTRDRLAAGRAADTSNGVDDAPPMPASLHDVLMARIDGAGAAKPLAQLAASFGAEFDAGLLARVAGPELDTASALQTLEHGHLIVRQHNERYRFSHALLQRAAYESQTRAMRRAVHRRIVQALTQADPELATREPETLAWHCSRAGDTAQACGHLLAAGEKAARRAAHREAMAHYRGALALLEQQPAGAERSVAQLQAQMALGVSAIAVHGYGAPQVRHIFEDAMHLAEPLGDDARLFPVYWGLWLGSSSWADFGRSIVLARRLVRLATRLGDAALLAHAQYALGNSLCCHGQFADAARALEAALQAYRPDDAERALGEDAFVTAQSFLSWTLWFLGRHNDALAASDAALARARQLAQPYSLLFALVFAAILRRWRGEVAAAEAFATEAANLAEEFGMALWVAAGRTAQGWARATRGDAAGIEEITAAMGHLNDIMGGVEAIFLSFLIEACDAVGETRVGLQTAERALHVAQRRKDRHWVSEFLRLKGTLLHTSGQGGQARIWLARALDVARELDAPSLIVRAAASLARHDRAGGHVAPDIIEALTDALARTSGGEALAEVRAARQLLADIIRSPLGS